MLLRKFVARCAAVLLLVGLTACGGGGGGTAGTPSPTTPTPVPAPSPAPAPVPTPSPTPALQPVVILDSSGQLASGFNIQVNTSEGRTDWLTRTSEGFQAAYPSSQQWGFVGIVLAGATAPGSRPGRDFSAYRSLQLQLRGAAGGENVEVGIKDNTDPDDGSEVKKAIVLTPSWQTFTFPLREFTTADLTRLYLVCELVFNGANGRTVFFRDIQYVP